MRGWYYDSIDQIDQEELTIYIFSLLAFDIPIESDDTNEPPLVLTIIWYNKSALVYAFVELFSC